MPRKAGGSEADAQMLRELAARGLSVSPFQLERWRLVGALPLPARRGLGRGKGSTSTYPELALPIAVLLACHCGQGRTLNGAVMTSFANGAPLPERGVRWALVRTIDRHERFVARVGREGRTEAVVVKAQRKISAYDLMLLAYNLEDQPDRAARDKRAATRRKLKDGVALVADLILHDELPASSDLVSEWLALSGLEETAQVVGEALRNEELAGHASTDVHFHDSLRCLALETPFERLCAARTLAGIWECINVLLVVGLVADGENKKRIADLLAEESVAWFRQTVHQPVGPLSTMTAVLSFAPEPWLEMGWEVTSAVLPLVASVTGDVFAAQAAPQTVVDMFKTLSEFDLGEQVPLETPDTALATELLWTMADQALRRRNAGQ